MIRTFKQVAFNLRVRPAVGGAKIRKECSRWREGAATKDLAEQFGYLQNRNRSQGRDLGPGWGAAEGEGQRRAALSLAEGWRTQKPSKQGSCDETFI